MDRTLSSGLVRFSHREEPAFTLIRSPEKAGTFRVSPGRLEKHEVENLGIIRAANHLFVKAINF